MLNDKYFPGFITSYWSLTLDPKIFTNYLICTSSWSHLNVTFSCSRNLFMPESKDWGELAVVSTLGLPSNTITLIVALFRLHASKEWKGRPNRHSYYSSSKGLAPSLKLIKTPKL